jgi:hypothetical protein
MVFHWATGVPFHNEMHSGAYDELTLWEQIDEGAQYTPAKKWLVSVPIVLYVITFTLCLCSIVNISRFLVSTHYTNYNPWIFALNITALVFNLVPKLPQVRYHINVVAQCLTLRSAAQTSCSFPAIRSRIRCAHSRKSYTCWNEATPTSGNHRVSFRQVRSL